MKVENYIEIDNGCNEKEINSLIISSVPSDTEVDIWVNIKGRNYLARVKSADIVRACRNSLN